MRAARVQAQAKINVFLIVKQREPDGYHELETLFHRIDLADEVTVRVGGSKRTLDVTGPAIPRSGLGPVERNLAYRAAEAFATRVGGDFASGFHIELTKHIPVGAGLGGGSADAGGVLRALNALAPTPLASAELVDLAASLGSDVPFLASEYVRARGSGRGERLKDVSWFPTGDALEMVVLVPQFSTSTADAYRWLDEDVAAGADPFPMPAPSPNAMRIGNALVAPLQPSSSWWRGYREFPSNSFEPVLEKRHPELRLLRERLLAAGAEMARLAGSGSCVFGVFLDRAPSAAALAVDAQVIATRTSSRVVQVEVLE